MYTATNFCMTIKLGEKKIYTGLATPPALAKPFCDTNAVTSDPFAVANLLVYQVTNH